MGKYANKFYGQHEDERVLYIVRPYRLVQLLAMVKFAVVALVIFFGFLLIGSQISFGGGVMVVIGLVLAILVGGGGMLMQVLGESKNVAYITDRRIVRFSAENPWVVSTRTLGWDQVVKVKTYAPNLLWRMINVGTLVVHAQSTVITSDEPKSRTYVSDDDVSLNDVWYYQDLGNYIDKLLYVYRQKPKELDEMRAFVTKPRGRRGA